MPVAHRELYDLAARTAGLGLSDYLTLVLAQAHRLQVPPTVRRVPDPEELPLRTL